MQNSVILFFFFNDTATTEIYTLSLHDALPISRGARGAPASRAADGRRPQDHAGLPSDDARAATAWTRRRGDRRSEEHTSELQSHLNLVCRLLLEKTIYPTKRHPAQSANVRCAG